MSDARIRAAEWVATDDGLLESYRVVLTTEPNREDWFARVLPDLDYELAGGTWERPIWAWTEHPWFKDLGLTNEECESYLQNPNVPLT